MKRLGQKRVSFSKVVIPGSVKLRQLMAEPRVIELARSFAEESGGRPLQPPTLDAKTFRLIAGADRLAACKVNGDESTIFELVEGTEVELRRLSIVENLRRRQDDRQKLARDLVEAIESDLGTSVPKLHNESDVSLDTQHGKSTMGTNVPNPDRGKRAEAIRIAAKETGRSEAAIKKAVQREDAKARAEEPKPEPAQLPAAKPPIRTFGLELPPKVMADAAQLQTMVDEMSKLAQALATKLTGLEAAFPQLGQQQRAREGLQQAAHAIRSIRPESLCPHCKPSVGDGKRTPKCLACKGLGFVEKAKLVDVPKELMADGDDCGVYVDGKWTLLDVGF